MVKLGNLFELAEKQLIQEKRAGIIPCYLVRDVIEYAIEIRRWLDINPQKAKEILKLTRAEVRRANKVCRRDYYLKTGR